MKYHLTERQKVELYQLVLFVKDEFGSGYFYWPRLYLRTGMEDR